MMEDFDALVDQTAQRAKDPEFMDRLMPVIDEINENVHDPEMRELAIGIAGLTLHHDDVRAGRWTA